MRKVLMALTLALLPFQVVAQNSFPTAGNGGPRVPGYVEMCLDGSGFAIPKTAAGQCGGGGALSPTTLFGLRQDANGTATGGGAYVTGDVLTLSGGTCTTPPQLLLWTSGAAPQFSVHRPGNCTAPPADPVSATGGSGTGATFTLASGWGPLAADVPAAPFVAGNVNGSLFYPPAIASGALGAALGPVCFTSIGGCGGGGNASDGMGGGTGMTGGENTLGGYNTGAQLTTGQWVSCWGHNACGHETTGSFIAVVGTDGAKWTTGASEIAGIGRNVFKFALNPVSSTVAGSQALQGGQFISAVSGAVNNGSGLCRVTVGSTTGMVTGDTSVVTGIAGATGVACNGVFASVVIVDGTHIDLTGSTFAGTYTTGGSVSDYGNVKVTRTVAIGTNSLGSSAFRSAGRLVSIGNDNAKNLTTAVDNVMAGDNNSQGITAGGQHVILGASAGNTEATGNGCVIVGYNSNVTGSAVGDCVLIGGSANGGGNGARGGGSSVIVGARSGNASLTATGITALGYNLINTTLASGNNGIYIGTNGNVDAGGAAFANAIVICTVASCTSAGSNTINIEKIVTVTGTGTPSTSLTTIAGLTAHTGTTVFDGAGAASVAAMLLDGAILTSGTATTNFPAFFIQPSGATAATNWNTAGTAIGVNLASGATADLANLQIAGSSKFLVNSNGAGTFASNLSMGANAVFAFTGRGLASSPGAGSWQYGGLDTDTNASIVAQTVRSQGALAGGTADQSGKNLTLIVSPGKGTGAGGSFIVQTSPAGSTGTAVNAPVTALTIDSTGKSTFAGEVDGASFVPTSSTVPTNGMYLSAANTVSFAANTARVMFLNNTGFNANGASGGAILAANASATAPAFAPNRGDGTTGIGAQSSGNISLIASGAEIARVTATAFTQIAGQTVTKGFTVGTLPTGIPGGRAHVTDQLTTCAVPGAAITGGGAVTCPVFFNGAAWVGGFLLRRDLGVANDNAPAFVDRAA